MALILDRSIEFMRNLILSVWLTLPPFFDLFSYALQKRLRPFLKNKILLCVWNEYQSDFGNKGISGLRFRYPSRVKVIGKYSKHIERVWFRCTVLPSPHHLSCTQNVMTNSENGIGTRKSFYHFPKINILFRVPTLLPWKFIWVWTGGFALSMDLHLPWKQRIQFISLTKGQKLYSKILD